MLRRHALYLRHRPFGRRTPGAPASPAPALADDLRMFALTFAGGFLFMTIYLA
ncbi:hypothetical protein [Sphingomonas xanthus]|uniref:hypothetical protein n=1 Tax=Sphingomonas xanthus TaxID=2594473 RepID=UPI00164D89A5|nr:hypothetical protein [Sphingomonas xanthus]